jgi:exoribonuclease II
MTASPHRRRDLKRRSCSSASDHVRPVWCCLACRQSSQDLADKILKFIEAYNRTAQPFRWSYDAKLKLRRCPF